MVKLNISSSDEDLLFLFEHIIKHLQNFYLHSYEESIELVNAYLAKLY